MKIEAIIPTAGIGQRLQSKIAKPFLKIGGVPIFIHTLKIFQKCSLINGIVVVGHRKSIKVIEKMVSDYKLSKVKKVIIGGRQRHNSVQNGLKAVDCDTDIIVIHDGVRPLLSKKILEKSIRLSNKYSAITTAVKVKPTIKKIDPKRMIVKNTLDRSQLWEIQTPQVFKKELIQRAYKKKIKGHPTDDAMLVEALGVNVKVQQGEYRNVKITTQEDLIIAESLMRHL